MYTYGPTYLYLPKYLHYTCTHTYIHSFIHTHTHTYIHSFIHTHLHTCIHSYIHIHTYTHIHTHIHAHKLTFKQTHIHKCILRTYIRTNAHTLAHRLTHTIPRTRTITKSEWYKLVSNVLKRKWPVRVNKIIRCFVYWYNSSLHEIIANYKIKMWPVHLPYPLLSTKSPDALFTGAIFFVKSSAIDVIYNCKRQN